MLNKVFIMGRLTRDPELRHTQNGTPVASFSLAVDRDFKDKTTGERGVDFIDVVAWRQTGEFVSRYFTKGRMAVVEGRLQVRSWTDKEGNKRYSTEVIADQIYFGDSKRDGNANPADTYNQGAYAFPAGANAGESGNNQGGYNMSSTGGDQYNELLEDDGNLPF